MIYITEKFDKQNVYNQIYNAAEEVMMSDDFGFPEDEVKDYLFVDVDEDEDSYRIEVRAEVSYEGMREIAGVLDPIVQKYDPYSYFDDVAPGIMDTYISKY